MAETNNTQSGGTAQTNNVWATLFTGAVNAYTANRAGKEKTKSAPDGAKPFGWNFLPGSLGQYPMAEGRGAPKSSIFADYGQYFIYAMLGLVIIYGLSMMRGK